MNLSWSFSLRSSQWTDLDLNFMTYILIQLWSVLTSILIYSKNMHATYSCTLIGLSTCIIPIGSNSAVNAYGENDALSLLSKCPCCPHLTGIWNHKTIIILLVKWSYFCNSWFFLTSCWLYFGGSFNAWANGVITFTLLAELLQGQPLPLIRTSVKNRGQLFYGSDAHGMYVQNICLF